MFKQQIKLPKYIAYPLIVLIGGIIIYLTVEAVQHFHKYTRESEMQKTAEARLNGVVNRIHELILSIEQVPKNLAYVLEFSNPNEEHLEVLLKAIVENNEEVYGTCIAFEPGAFNANIKYFAPYIYQKNGQVVSADAYDSTYYYFSMDWYLIPKTLQKPVWIEPYYDEGSSGANIVLATYSSPFYYYDGLKETFKGVVTADISLDWLSNLVGTIKPYDSSYAILISENGTVLSAPNKQWAYNESIYTLADEQKQPQLREIGRNLKNGKAGYTKIANYQDGRSWWIFYKPIPKNNWGVLLFIPEEKS